MAPSPPPAWLATTVSRSVPPVPCATATATGADAPRRNHHVDRHKLSSQRLPRQHDEGGNPLVPAHPGDHGHEVLLRLRELLSPVRRPIAGDAQPRRPHGRPRPCNPGPPGV